MRIRLASILAAISLPAASSAQTSLVGLFSECDYLVPSVENGGAALAIEDWTAVEPPVNLSHWPRGSLGIGYGSESERWIEFLSWDVFHEMRYINSSLFIRVPFRVEAGQLTAFSRLLLEVRFDDVFIIHLNGSEVLRFNAPDLVTWESASTSPYPDSEGATPHPFDLTQHLGLLREGENILAIQLLNNSPLSQDVFILPELSAYEQDEDSIAHPRHLSVLAVTTHNDGLPNTITIGAAAGRIYQLQQSSNLVDWSDRGLPVIARGVELSFAVSAPGSGRHFYRVVEL